MRTGNGPALDNPSFVTERAFQEQLRQLADVYGWRYYHTHDSRRSPAGFPDVVLVKGSRIIFAELKAEKGRLSPEQRGWISALEGAGQEVHVWRPSHFETIRLMLAGGAA